MIKNKQQLLSLILLVCFLLTSPAHAQSLKAVAKIKVAYEAGDNLLHVNWDLVRSAWAYKVRLFDGDNQLIKAVITSRESAKFKASLLIEGNAYAVSIEALTRSPLKNYAEKKKSFVFSTKVKTEKFYGNLKSINTAGRSGVYFLPKNYRLRTLPIMLLFHGSSIDGRKISRLFKALAEKEDFIIIAPDSKSIEGWEIEIDGGEPSEDQSHIQNCLDEVLALPHISIDSSRFLIAGVSAGGAVAAFIGSNDSRFSHIAVLHGGIILRALGTNKVPVWLSTGTEDELRTPEELKRYEELIPSYGFSDVSYSEYAIGHNVHEQEKLKLLDWWLR